MTKSTWDMVCKKYLTSSTTPIGRNQKKRRVEQIHESLFRLKSKAVALCRFFCRLQQIMFLLRALNFFVVVVAVNRPAINTRITIFTWHLSPAHIHTYSVLLYADQSLRSDEVQFTLQKRFALSGIRIVVEFVIRINIIERQHYTIGQQQQLETDQLTITHSSRVNCFFFYFALLSQIDYVNTFSLRFS